MPRLAFTGAVVLVDGFVGGEEVAGTLVVSTTKPCVTRSITLELTGVETSRVSVTEIEGGKGQALVLNLLAIAGGHVPHATAKTTTYRERSTIVETRVILAGAAEASGV